MRDQRDIALRGKFVEKTKLLASEVGFCINDSLADALAESVVYRISTHASECESRINHLFRGRETFTLSNTDRRALEKAAERFAYMAKTAREVLAAQEQPEPSHLMAAE